MRWKIQLLASILMAALAVLLFAGISRVLNGAFIGRGPIIYPSPWPILGVLLPAGAAAVFVYRHTARERKTQALITFALCTILAVVTLTLISYFV